MKKFYFKKITLLVTLITLFGLSDVFGQTVILNPAGDGGFETGATFALNNWTATTGTTNPRNNWICGTAATGYTGNRGANISQNGTNHQYNNTSRVSHLYRDITAPANKSDIKLSFSWIGDGESTYDYMSVWLVPTSYTPAYGTAITTTGAAPTGRVQIGLSEYSLQTSWTTSGVITIPIAYTGTTFRLVFEWKNDNSTKNNPPAAIDNVSVTANLKVFTTTAGSRCGSGSVTLGATADAGTTAFRWYTVPTGGSFATTLTGSYATPTIATTTTYYVSAYDGTLESLRTPVIATVNPITTASVSPITGNTCSGAVTLNYTGSTTGFSNTLFSENFNSIPDIKMIIQEVGSGSSTNGTWFIEDSPSIDVSYNTVNSGSSLFAAIDSYYDFYGYSNNALTMQNSINTTNYASLSLNFRHYYDEYGISPDEAIIEVNTDNNLTGTWTAVQTYTSDQGSATSFASVMIDLSAYKNQPTLRVRFRYNSDWNYGWNIDDISITGVTKVPEVVWTPATGLYTDAGLTTAYVAQKLNTVYANPSSDQIYTATVTNFYGCTSTAISTITKYNKVWIGTTTDWSDGANWSPSGVPSASDCVYIDTGANSILNSTNNYVKKVIVKNPGVLIVNADKNLIVTDEINIIGTGVFELKNNSNLVQINDVANSGNIIYERTAPSIKGSDYVYWSSPVANQAINSIYTSPVQGPKYSWDTQVNNNNGQFGNISNGNWANASGVNMAIGSGYLIRGSSNYSMAATDINSTFTGVPNNGSLSTPVYVYKGTYTDITGYLGMNGASITNMDDNHNLLGNPYPSAISALQFISDNSTILEGKVKLWKHAFDPSNTNPNPFYANYAINYSANDYVTINSTGASISGFSENIKTGQAFFVEMKDAVGVVSPATVNFNNAQRRDGLGVPYANDAFYRNSSQQNTNTIERHRIWLDIVDANSISETILLGYVTGASAAKESNFDAIAEQLTLGIYSIIASENFVIQGRGLPFDDNDQVSIGFNVPTAGNYSIAISAADGLFLGTQDVYLKDEVLNIYHDLKTTPYSFTATAGIHNDRFKIVYKNGALSNEIFNENEIIIAKNKNIIDIVSGTQIMENVKVYDVRGRLLVEKSKINNNTISIDINNIQDQVLIVNIVTTEGIKVIRKIL